MAVLHALGDYAGTKAAYQRALAILERHLPGDHQYIQITRRNLEQLEEEIKRKG